jgi:hypothetical protein
MKLRKEGSIGIIIGGALAIISAMPITNDLIIPGQIKLWGGIGLIVFGLARLLYQYNNKEEQRKNQRTAALITLLLIIGIGVYFYFNSADEKKTFKKEYGSFEVQLNKIKYRGEAILEGDKLIIQIKKIRTHTRISGFKLYNKEIEIDSKSIEWVCALMSDLRVIRCSTSLDLPNDNFKMFVDNDTYTIMYWMQEPLYDVKISDIAFMIVTDKDEQKITIMSRE